MDNQRLFLYGAFFFVVFLLWQAWQKEQAPTASVVAESPAGEAVDASAPQASADIPVVEGLPSSDAPTADQAPAASALPEQREEPAVAAGEPVRVQTDVYDIVINTRGADINVARLTNYPRESRDDKEVVELLSDEGQRLFIMQSGLRAKNDAPAPDHRSVYQTAANSYELQAGEDHLEVSFFWQGDGVEIEKRYRFERGSYRVGLEYIVTNTTDSAWRGDQYLQLKKYHVPPERSLFDPSSFAYNGPVIYDEEYEKLDLEDISEQRVSRDAEGGWVAMLQHYFAAAVIPPQGTVNRLYAAEVGRSTYRIGFVQPEQGIPSGSSRTFGSELFLGPKLQDQLATAAPKLELAVDYGMLTIIAEPLFWLLDNIHGLIGNWGWAIILLVLLIKAVFYKLSEASGKSMAKMRQVQPRIQALKERYGDDREKMNRAMMELYQKEKINPAAGCLPMLIQFPVFIALYWVLLESVELRQADFMLWLNDLSTPDPFYVLPVLMGLAVWGQQKMNPTPPDPIQQKLLMIMPVMMAFFATVMPSGLVLYWVVNSVLTAAQQWQINRVIDRKGLRG
ncbi:MAG: membrane protein insertase YidC [Gammaproteobacteria bacterium]|nr:membrane protein insertase YidC [Gammaproteobacteria bacterium]